jgi:hypothetical protein
MNLFSGWLIKMNGFKEALPDSIQYFQPKKPAVQALTQIRQVNPSGGSTIAGDRTSEILTVFPISQDGFLDGSSVVDYFDMSCTARAIWPAGDATRWLVAPSRVSTFSFAPFSRVTVYSGSNEVLEDLANYNDLARLVSQRASASEANLLASMSSLIQSGADRGLLEDAIPATVSTRSRLVRCSHPIMSGFLNSQKMLPVFLLNSGFSIARTLENPRDLFVIDANVATTFTYTLQNFRTSYSMTSVGSDFVKSFKAYLAEKGLPGVSIMGTSYIQTQQTIPNTTGPNSVRISVPRSSCDSLSFFIKSGASADPRVDQSNPTLGNLSSYQWNLGGVPRPSQPVSLSIATEPAVSHGIYQYGSIFKPILGHHGTQYSHDSYTRVEDNQSAFGVDLQALNHDNSLVSSGMALGGVDCDLVISHHTNPGAGLSCVTSAEYSCVWNFNLDGSITVRF